MECGSSRVTHIGNGYGKVLLLGGFCVLNEGGKGIALSLSPCIRCKCVCDISDRPTEGESVFVSIITKFGANNFSVDKTSGDIQSDEFEGLKFLKVMFRKVVRMRGYFFSRCERISLEITADKSFYIDENGKTGLGSSSAFTVSVCKAVFGCLSECDKDFDNFETVKDIALEVHKEGQGGIGSGYDILSNIYGSIFLEKRDGELKCSSIKVPACLELTLLGIKSIDKKGTSSSEQVRMFDKFVSAEQKLIFINAVNNTSSLLKETFEELNSQHNETGTNDKERIVEIVKRMKEPIRNLRGCFQTLSKLNPSFIIEPPELKTLLDELNERDDVLLALVPGAGGYDSPCVLGIKGWHEEYGKSHSGEIELTDFEIRDMRP